MKHQSLWAKAEKRRPSGESLPYLPCVSSEPLGVVKNLQVLNPTMTTLNVRWEPAEGRVKEYRIAYVPAAGGPESTVRLVGQPSASCWLELSRVGPKIK